MWKISLTDVAVIIGLSVFFYFIFIRNRKRPPKTPQELFEWEQITPDGIVVLPGQKYRLMLEVLPTNLTLKSASEQSAAWLAVRSSINSMNMPFDWILQSRLLDMKEYLARVRERSKQAPTPQLADYGDYLADQLDQRAEGKRVRDRRCYVLLKLDLSDLSHVNSGLQLTNESLNTLFNMVPKETLNQEDALDMARQELENTADVVIGTLSQIDGLQVYRMNQEGVLDYIYNALNRDLAPVAKLEDATRQGVFTSQPLSLTPFLAEED